MRAGLRSRRMRARTRRHNVRDGPRSRRVRVRTRRHGVRGSWLKQVHVHVRKGPSATPETRAKISSNGELQIQR